MEFKTVVDKISAKCPGSIVKQGDRHGTGEITVSAESFFEVMKTLQGDPDLSFDILIDVVGIDWLPRAPRFDLVYVLLSTRDFTRLLVRMEVGEGQDVPSVTGIWQSANWAEREVFDLMGVNFTDHPDLRRILTWENFEGHPLRKDFPLEGKDFDKPFDVKTIKDYC